MMKSTPGGSRFATWEERVEDPSLQGWTPGPARLAAGCFESSVATAKISSRWSVWFDSKGRATKAAQEAGWPALDDETATCVQKALMSARAPCPARAGLRATADLHITLRDPSAAQPNVFGPGGLGNPGSPL